MHWENINMTVIILNNLIKYFMAEGSGTFGNSMQTSGKLHQMLLDPNITPENLFSVSNMNGDIKQNIQAFLKFCRKRKEFTTRMFKISLNSPYQEIHDEKTKRVAQHTIDLLTNDEDALCNFLFDKKEELKIGSEIEEKVQETLAPTIQSEAQKLFNDTPNNKQEAEWEKDPDAFQKYELVEMSLAHLKEQNKNQTCLGYINKLYSSLLRREGNLFLQFLKQKPQYIDLLINNIGHYSIGNMVALVLSCEDKSGQYKHEELKKFLFDKILAYGFNNVGNSQKFDGFLSAIQQILNSTKQSYYQYFEDFKRCSNILVSQQTLRKFYAALDTDEISFGNASNYLELIIKRINSQSEEHDYYRQHESSQPTMKFQHTFFYKQFKHLLELIEISQKYPSTIRLSYLAFLINLLKNMKDQEASLSNDEVFKKLINSYSQEKVTGIVKNYLFQLAKSVIKRMKEEQIKNIAKWLAEYKSGQQEFLKTILAQNNTVKINKNQTSCFILSLLFEVQNRCATFLKEYNQKQQLNLTQIYDKFKAKLADYGQEEEVTSPSGDQIELVMKFPSKTDQTPFVLLNQLQNEGQKESQTQVVGKNNVVIPVLNLPSKNSTKVTIQEEQVEQVKLPVDLSSRQALIRDLKNTRIQLPEKFKFKKPQQAQRKPQTPVQQNKDQKNQKQINLKLSLQQQQKQGNQQSSKLNVQVLKVPVVPLPIPLISPGIEPQEQKYFIKHILLF